MRINQLLILFAIFFTGTAYAQPPAGMPARGGAPGPSITGRITGTLLDTLSQQPVEFATVVLVNAADQKQVDGTMTEADGSFKLNEVRLGEYELHFSFLGYRNKVLKGIELTPEKPDAHVDNVLIVSEGVTLAEVEVTGEAALVENRIDKIVYNAEKDVTTVGGDAVDVLQKVPLLAVDMDGNVSLRGSQNLQILINGKPSTIFSGSIADALRTIPADQIKSVEVITTPTAKYDGEGSAGIINIVTKKKSAEGITGSVSGAVGNQQNRGSLNLSYARGRFGLNFTGSGFWRWPNESLNSFYREDYRGDTTNILTQDGVGESNFYGPRGSVSAFYDINAYNSLTSSLNFRGFGRNNDGITNANYQTLIDGVLDEENEQIYIRDSDSKNFRNGFDWTTDYRRTFEREKQEFRLAFQISGDNSLTKNNLEQRDLKGNAPELNFTNYNENQGLNLEYTFQGDYTHPFGDNVTMETGAKAILRRIDSDYSYENLGDGVAIPDTSDIFYYNQDVVAGYMSFNINLGENYGMVAGGRYENTRIAGSYQKDPSTFENSYGNFLPSFIISRKLSQFSSLKASYTRRIQRPSLRFVNPYLQLDDPRSVTIGNPELSPELTDLFELSYNTYIKGIVLNASIYYRYTDDIIESYVEIIDDGNYEGVSRTTYLNIGENRSIGLDLFSSATLWEVLTLRGGFNIYSYNAKSTREGLDLERQAIIYRANLNGTLSLPKDFKIEAFGFFNSPRQTLQGSRASFSMFSIGARKEFMNKRASLGLSVTQPFSKYMRFPQELEGENFYQESEFRFIQRSINLTFSYRFGKMDFRDRRNRRSAINNNDQMQGGDDNGQSF